MATISTGFPTETEMLYSSVVSKFTIGCSGVRVAETLVLFWVVHYDWMFGWSISFFLLCYSVFFFLFFFTLYFLMVPLLSTFIFFPTSVLTSTIFIILRYWVTDFFCLYNCCTYSLHKRPQGKRFEINVLRKDEFTFWFFLIKFCASQVFNRKQICISLCIK